MLNVLKLNFFPVLNELLGYKMQIPEFIKIKESFLNHECIDFDI
jgi:hypothetical protein